MLCCLGLTRPVKVVPVIDQSKQHADLQPAGVQDCLATSAQGHLPYHRVKFQTNRPREVTEAASQLHELLHDLLSAAGLAPASNSNNYAHQSREQKLPCDLEQLTKQLVAACRAKGQSQNAVAKTAAQLSYRLVQYSRRLQQQGLQAMPDIYVPSADVLMNMINLTVFAQVSLDSSAVLQQRYKQYSQLLASLGLDDNRIAACVQPAGKGLIACLLLGSKATTGEVKVSLVVQRYTAFWDAVEQLQQQGHIRPHNTQQAAEAVHLAKLFPRFVDGQLLQKQQQQLSNASTHLQPGFSSNSGSGSSSSSASSTAAGIPVESGEGHGPRKEFFLLIGETLTKPGPDQEHQPAMFVHLRSADTWWFNTILPQTAQLQAAFWAAGWLLAQTIVNRCTLGLQLSPLLFHRLLQAPTAAFKVQPSLAMLEQHDPEAAKGLKSILRLPTQQFRELLHMECKPPGLSRQQYVEQAVQQLLVEDVAWQYEALRQGFYAAVDQQMLLGCCFSGVSLACAICGPATDSTADFNLRLYFRIATEDDAYSSSSCGNSPGSAGLLLQCLWQVVDSWSPQQKRALVKFVTGSDKLPAPGSEQWLISFPFVAYGTKQQRQLLGTLPQSHTCANTLELPNYIEALVATQPELAREWELEGSAATGGGSNSACRLLQQRCRDTLQDRLMVAITSCDGYALDEASAAMASTQQHTTARAHMNSSSASSKQAALPTHHATATSWE